MTTTLKPLQPTTSRNTPSCPTPTPQVWDMRRLERDVSFRSRLTYAGQSGPILAVAGVEDGQSAASASASGSLHVWRVDYTCKAGSSAPDKYNGGCKGWRMRSSACRYFLLELCGGVAG